MVRHMSEISEVLRAKLNAAMAQGWYLFGQTAPGSDTSDKVLAAIADISIMLGNPPDAFPAEPRKFGKKPPEQA